MNFSQFDVNAWLEDPIQDVYRAAHLLLGCDVLLHELDLQSRLESHGIAGVVVVGRGRQAYRVGAGEVSRARVEIGYRLVECVRRILLPRLVRCVGELLPGRIVLIHGRAVYIV